MPGSPRVARSRAKPAVSCDRLAAVPGGVSATTPVLTPAEKRTEFEQHSPLYHVFLLDDDEHTYDYVVEMLQKLFLMPTDVAFQHAVEVDTTGRTIVITCELPQAEFARDQVHAYGADPRMPKSKGSMTAILVPARQYQDRVAGSPSFALST